MPDRNDCQHETEHFIEYQLEADMPVERICMCMCRCCNDEYGCICPDCSHDQPSMDAIRAQRMEEERAENDGGWSPSD